MTLSIDDLLHRLDPTRTSLLLGAGAAVPSGAPTGAQLAQKLWRVVANSDSQSDDLIETSGILERRFGRRPLVDAVIQSLEKLSPTGGLLAIPRFPWHAIFSTNFDKLVEKAYQTNDIPLVAIRSNYDLTYRESTTETKLYKIHGCISQDQSLGDKASMILTEQNYDDFEKYRQSMFALLNSHLLTGDVLVIGQSLRDRHLAELIKRVLKMKDEGAPGQVFLLIYDKDDLRAPLFEDRGARIAFGGIDEFMHSLSNRVAASPLAVKPHTSTLPLSIVSAVVDVAQAQLGESNVVRMFNGASAGYADIRSDSTFQRAQVDAEVARISRRDASLLTIVGAAGVGKTTFARQAIHRLHEMGIRGIEHRSDFNFQSAPWISYEADLRSKGDRAVLMLDECTRYMRQANLLAEHLAGIQEPALSLVMTANAAQWAPRLKSPVFFKRGSIIELSRLVDADLHSLVNLVERNRIVSSLVDAEYKSLSRQLQFARLRERCSADMFVCLKNIFANDSLDKILLSEFDELPPVAQEYYRYIAALESVGMRVHRLLVMRMLGIRADAVAGLLEGLSGIIDEFEINAREGIYGWSTRHIVIARKITDYKFSGLEELERLFEKIIESINPAVPTELQSIRDLCDAEFGIGRLGDTSLRKRLYRSLIRVAPAERIPWHRYVRELLREGNLEETSYAIRDAIAAVGSDGPIDRYSVRLIERRAEDTEGIGEGDRVALLRRAYELANTNIDKHRRDKHSYRVLCDVAIKLVRRGESIHYLTEAIARMRDASDFILDPDMARELRSYENEHARLN
jgi:hypothetical protein